MKTWLSVRSYAKLIGKDYDEVIKLIDDGVVVSKKVDGEIYVETDSHQTLPTKHSGGDILKVDLENGDGIQFVEKTIGTILNMHEKVMDAKDETLEALKSENQFLKEALMSMQELYDEDRSTIETLSNELNATRDELEFMKRKYKLMWGKVVEKHAGESS